MVFGDIEGAVKQRQLAGSKGITFDVYYVVCMIRGQVCSNTAWVVHKKGSHGKVDGLHLYCINTMTI